MGAVAEQHPATRDHLRRAADPGYRWWLAHVKPAAACSHPVRLRIHTAWHDPDGQVVEAERVSDDMPDGLLYVACKNRRATVCPGCAATYRADMYQLIKAGLVGGKGVPDTVVRHPCLFVTLTAPSFGLMHTTGKPGHPRPCTPRRHPTRCPHGVLHVCWRTHEPDEGLVGQPLCRDCYDYHHQAVWNLHASELWRRTTITLRRELTRGAKHLGLKVRVQYTKVAEYQRRGAVHYHALIRLDGHNPDQPDSIVAPDPGITAAHVRGYVEHAAKHTAFTTAPHRRNGVGWHITWGDQFDIRVVRLAPSDLDDTGHLTTTAVAGYLAKYATKATEDTGHVSTKLTAGTLGLHTEHDTHQTRQLQACWYLGQRPLWMTSPQQRQHWAEGWGRLQRWAHMLGYGGHFATKSRRYSTTLAALRVVRAAYQRGEQPPPPGEQQPQDADPDGDHAEITITYTLDGVGWLTTADAQLANTAAAKAREHCLTARQETETAFARGGDWQ